MFYDLDDNLTTFFRFTIESEEEKTGSWKIDCQTKILFASETVGLEIYGRHLGDVTWTDLINDGLDLSSWDGDRETFEFKFIADTTTVGYLEDFYFYFV